MQITGKLKVVFYLSAEDWSRIAKKFWKTLKIDLKYEKKIVEKSGKNVTKMCEKCGWLEKNRKKTLKKIWKLGLKKMIKILNFYPIFDDF